MNKLQIHFAAEVLHQGGIIAYPTESVYGFGCDPQNESAILALLKLKKRSAKRGLILIASSIEQLSPYIADLNDELFNKVDHTWPGPTTWLLPPGKNSTFFLRGEHSLQAVRVSNHPAVINLCNKFGGAIVSTSANITNRPSAKTALHVHQQFHGKLDYILKGNVGGLKKPCEIRNGLNSHIVRSSD